MACWKSCGLVKDRTSGLEDTDRLTAVMSHCMFKHHDVITHRTHSLLSREEVYWPRNTISEVDDSVSGSWSWIIIFHTFLQPETETSHWHRQHRQNVHEEQQHDRCFGPVRHGNEALRRVVVGLQLVDRRAERVVSGVDRTRTWRRYNSSSRRVQISQKITDSWCLRLNILRQQRLITENTDTEDIRTKKESHICNCCASLWCHHTDTRGNQWGLTWEWPGTLWSGTLWLNLQREDGIKWLIRFWSFPRWTAFLCLWGTDHHRAQLIGPAGDRLGRPKCTVRVCWECLAEPSLRGVWVRSDPKTGQSGPCFLLLWLQGLWCPSWRKPPRHAALSSLYSAHINWAKPGKINQYTCCVLMWWSLQLAVSFYLQKVFFFLLIIYFDCFTWKFVFHTYEWIYLDTFISSAWQFYFSTFSLFC